MTTLEERAAAMALTARKVAQGYCNKPLYLVFLGELEAAVAEATAPLRAAPEGIAPDKETT